jgi:WD40 repeat protein
LSGDDRWFVSKPDLKPEMLPDGKFVVAKIRLWDVEKGKEVRSFKLFETTLGLVGQYIDFFAEGKGSNGIIATALSHDGKWVAAGTEHGDVHLWETDTGKKVRAFGRYKDFGAAPIGFSKNGKWLVTSVFHWTRHDGKPELRASVLLWDVATGEVKHEIEVKQEIGGDKFLWNSFFENLTEDGKRLITSQDEKTVRIWDVETGKEVGSFTGGNDAVMDCFVSHDKKLLTTYDQSGTVRLWEVATGKELRVIKARTPTDSRWEYVNFKVRVSSDAKLFVAWTPSRLTLWNLESGKPIRSVERRVNTLFP